MVALRVVVRARRRSLLALALLFAWPAVTRAQDLDPARVDRAARAFMEGSGAPGLAVGVVTPAGARVLSYGVASRETGAPVDERTLFEIGSVSKTFTAALAARGVESGVLRWDDAPGRHLPELRGGRIDELSLLNLATHTTGGMPLQLPDDVRTGGDLLAYYRAWAPPAPPGTTRTYANPSIGLLGVVTARALGGDFADLVRAELFAPLGMARSHYAVPRDEARHEAQGYTRDGRPVRLSAAPLAAEAYGVRTTAGDLLRFVAAHLGLIEVDPPLRRALAATRTGHFTAGPMTQALIWEWYPLPVSEGDLAAGNGEAMVLQPQPATPLVPPRPAPGDALVNKTGATNGFGAYVAFVPGRRTGVVLLANRNHPTAARLVLAREVLAALGVPGVASAP